MIQIYPPISSSREVAELNEARIQCNRLASSAVRGSDGRDCKVRFLKIRINHRKALNLGLKKPARKRGAGDTNTLLII
jgi:hypothetical protein